jgi:hypothetical protein
MTRFNLNRMTKTQASNPTGERTMKTKTLIPFLALSFGLTWGLAAILMLFYDQVVAIFGEVGLTNPLFILAVYSPGFAGVFLVWRHYGLRPSTTTAVSQNRSPKQSLWATMTGKMAAIAVEFWPDERWGRLTRKCGSSTSTSWPK